MARTFTDRFKHCPYCGRLFKGGCQCEYGKHVKMKMDFDNRLRDLYIKKFCPSCGERASKTKCGFCGHVFDHTDMFY